jgi:hypothetical protein
MSVDTHRILDLAASRRLLATAAGGRALGAGLAAIVIALILGYAVSVSATYTAAGVIAVAIVMYAVLRPRRPNVKTHQILAYTALVAYLLPLLAFGKIYATVGSGQIYLPDVLIAIAALLIAPTVHLRRISPFSSLCVLIALLALHAVYVGWQNHYLEATKGLVLAFYPIIAVVVAGWLAAQPSAEYLLSALPKYILPWIVVGLALLLAVHATLIAAAAGLALGIMGAFAVVPGMPRRRWLGGSFVAGTILLVGFNSKRGPTLAILLAVFVAWIASAQFRASRTLPTLTALCAVLMALVLATSLGALAPKQIPIAGPLIARTFAIDSTATNNGVEKAAANNIGIRQAIWSYALHATNDNPLFGRGAYHPIEVDYLGNNLVAQTGIGTHDSFVGYAFYAGYPAAALVVFVFLLGLIRTWKLRLASIYAPALLGSLVAVTVTALTNVALETTYIGGPSWLVLGAAIGLAGAHQNSLSHTSQIYAGNILVQQYQPAVVMSLPARKLASKPTLSS